MDYYVMQICIIKRIKTVFQWIFPKAFESNFKPMLIMCHMSIRKATKKNITATLELLTFFFFSDDDADDSKEMPLCV